MRGEQKVTTDGRTDGDGCHCVTICMAGLRSDLHRLPKGRALASRLVNKSQWRSGGSNRLVKRGTDQYEALQPLAVRLPHGLRTQIFGHNEYLCVFVELVALFLSSPPSSCCAARFIFIICLIRLVMRLDFEVGLHREWRRALFFKGPPTHVCLSLLGCDSLAYRRQRRRGRPQFSCRSAA